VREEIVMTVGVMVRVMVEEMVGVVLRVMVTVQERMKRMMLKILV
jgi:hypothetical protein